MICLAITEPSAGSDVANLKTEAVKTPDGKHYIVNGEKKWITNGVFADFFTVAVRTGGEGMGGVSFFFFFFFYFLYIYFFVFSYIYF